MSNECTRAEELAGAVALGEAGDAERDLYRRHLATCQWCLANLGGEREIERVMGAIARARDAERWEPDLRAVFDRKRATSWMWKLGTAGAMAVLVAAFGMYAQRSAIQRPDAGVALSPTQRDERAIAALSTQTGPRREHQAESLAVSPPAAAMLQSATFTVSVDSRGVPIVCTIAQSSGSQALDRAVCQAAMRAHYETRRIGGQGSPSVYRGSFTLQR